MCGQIEAFIEKIFCKRLYSLLNFYLLGKICCFVFLDYFF